MEERDTLLRGQSDSLRNIQRSDAVFLRQSRKASSKSESALTKEMQSIQGEIDVITSKVQSWNVGSSNSLQAHKQSIVALVTQLTVRLKTMDSLIQSEVRVQCSAVHFDAEACILTCVPLYVLLSCRC